MNGPPWLTRKSTRVKYKNWKVRTQDSGIFSRRQPRLSWQLARICDFGDNYELLQKLSPLVFDFAEIAKTFSDAYDSAEACWNFHLYRNQRRFAHAAIMRKHRTDELCDSYATIHNTYTTEHGRLKLENYSIGNQSCTNVSKLLLCHQKIEIKT